MNQPTTSAPVNPCLFSAQPFLLIETIRVCNPCLDEDSWTARRKGTSWYVDGLAAVEAVQLELPLSFLGEGAFEARVWKDAPNVAEDPNQLTIEHSKVNSKDVMKINIAIDGGFVAGCKRHQAVLTSSLRLLQHDGFAFRFTWENPLPMLGITVDPVK